MSNIKELIRAEIRKWQSNIEAKCPESTSSRNYTKEEWNAIYEYNAYTRILSFLDTLPDEPEQPTRGYDEAYLNEKIAKASKSWKGVDVDKFMDEIRGREPVSDCHDLKEAAENPYVLNDVSHAAFEYERTRNDLDARSDNEVVRRAFIAGAEWQKRKMISALKNDGELPIEFIDKFHEIDRNAFQNGQKNMKEQIMEGAVEGEVCILPGHVAYVKEKNNESLKQYLLDNFKAGDEVRVIILPNDEDNDRTIV